MAARHKMVGLSVSITEKAKTMLDRQARERGIPSSMWSGQVFDVGFAAICAREKSMPIEDGDLDAIVGATLLLRSQKDWNTPDIAKQLGVPEGTVARILAVWRDYRCGQDTTLKPKRGK
ncbi:MAG: helix-turn-helix protein [Rhizobium sp.]|nr:helix-turn-helix protein [Rhizobium sp.]